jgi:ABC-type transporter Mla maintaining outer membrane lipid asymmetry ATPase subunit MlaF
MSGMKALWSLKDVFLRARDGKRYSVPPFEIHKGERVALVGPHRDLRRAIFRLLSGLEAPWSGSFMVEGERIPCREERHPWRDVIPQKTRRKMGVSLEMEGLLSNVSIRESMETLFRFKYGDHNAGLIEGAQRAARETAAQMGLSEQHLESRPAELRPLERRLASLCLAFMSKPSILMLENPSLALHDEGWSVLSQVLKDIMEGSQRTFLMDTDDWLLARTHAQKWIVCHEDALIEITNCEDFISRNSSKLMSLLKSQKYREWNKWIEELEQGVA